MSEWTVRIHPLAEAELKALPDDMRGRFLHISDLLETFGPMKVGMPHKMKTMKTLKREMLADAATRAAYEAQAEEFAIAHELIAARARAGLTQGEVAERMGTTQSVVARLESGKRPPSMRTVERFAQAVGGHVVFRIEAVA